MATTAGAYVVATSLFDERVGGWGIVPETIPVQFVVANSLSLDDDEIYFGSGEDCRSVGLDGSHDDSNDGQGGGLCEQHV